MMTEIRWCENKRYSYNAVLNNNYLFPVILGRITLFIFSLL